jgi:hypothetical protein
MWKGEIILSRINVVSTGFCNLTPCNLVDVCRRFRLTSCLLQICDTTCWHMAGDSKLISALFGDYTSIPKFRNNLSVPSSKPLAPEDGTVVPYRRFGTTYRSLSRVINISLKLILRLFHLWRWDR